MSDPGGSAVIASLSDVPDAILHLQRSSRRTLPAAVLGLALTIAAGAAGVYYIFSLSADLRAARTELLQTTWELDAARGDLRTARMALGSVRVSIPAADRRNVDAALSNVLRSEQNLATASASLQQATDRLPDTAAEPEQWFAVIASYTGDEAGLGRARRRLAAMAESGNCFEIWYTRISNNHAVVLGGAGERAVARQNVERARQGGIAPDAFVQRNRDWTFIERSSNCVGAQATPEAESAR